jgi:hypothetical protein
MRATRTAFFLQASLRAFENGEAAGARDWDETIPRDLA